jgi:hypothetical protein
MVIGLGLFAMGLLSGLLGQGFQANIDKAPGPFAIGPWFLSVWLLLLALLLVCIGLFLIVLGTIKFAVQSKPSS